MDHLVIAFLTLAPLKMGIHTLLDSVGVLINNTKFRISTALSSILFSTLYLLIFTYIYKNLDESGTGFEHDRTIKLFSTIISLILLIITLSLSYLKVDDPDCKSNKTDESFLRAENIIYLIFICYILFKSYGSVKKLYKGNYTTLVTENEIYAWMLVAIILIILKLYYINTIANRQFINKKIDN